MNQGPFFGIYVVVYYNRHDALAHKREKQVSSTRQAHLRKRLCLPLMINAHKPIFNPEVFNRFVDIA